MADAICFLRLPEVESRVGLKKSKIYMLVKAGAFPKPRKQGCVSYWPDTEIHAWQLAQMADA